nr:hypothetical protein [Tanacetum cinerariifolium]
MISGWELQGYHEDGFCVFFIRCETNRQEKGGTYQDPKTFGKRFVYRASPPLKISYVDNC